MQPALICHGGSGDIAEDRHQPCLEGVQTACEHGHRLLEDGATALDAVEAVVRLLEDNPQFNAGHGSVLDERGEILTDASIMSGHDRRAGAIGAVSGIANPVSLARKVLEDGRHVFLVGQGAEEFARDQGFDFQDPASFIAEHERQRWEAMHGTVGCVALDREGRLAAATSTGGVIGKRRGRIGDSPLIGVGNWADRHIAVSCTGQGEAIMRTALAHYTASRHEDFSDPADLARAAIHHLGEATGGHGGLILVDQDGHVAFGQNTRRMPVCGIGVNGRIEAV